MLQLDKPCYNSSEVNSVGTEIAENVAMSLRHGFHVQCPLPTKTSYVHWS